MGRWEITRHFFQKNSRLVAPSENDVDRPFWKRSPLPVRGTSSETFRISSKRRIFGLLILNSTFVIGPFIIPNLEFRIPTTTRENGTYH